MLTAYVDSFKYELVTQFINPVATCPKAITRKGLKLAHQRGSTHRCAGYITFHRMRSRGAELQRKYTVSIRAPDCNRPRVTA